MGAGPEQIHPALAGDSAPEIVARNRDNYRITDSDGLGEGSAKDKFRRNVLAIELLRSLEARRRTATPTEQSVLVQYVGWGGLPQVFASAREAPQWQPEQKQLKELLSPDEYVTARATVLNAHYTSPLVVGTMYAGLDRLGFRHGRILEPACGLGHFFGAMPPDMRDRSELTGIEIDPLTARLAAMLYPGAEVRAQPFEESVLPTNSFDLAISNVPFGDYAPFDPKLNPRKFRIHDYYFLAALERIRPGGLVAFITSHGTMDKQHALLREMVAEQADLVAAIRLPNTAFRQNANTRVTTDILYLRKRLPGEKPNGVAWTRSEPFNVGGPEPIALNEYYHRNIEMMLGRMQVAERGMYGRNEPELAGDGRNLGQALSAAMTSLPANIYQSAIATEAAARRQTLSVPAGVKPNSYKVTELGGIARREGNELVLLEGLPAPTVRRLRGLIRVREAVRDCLQTQVENRGEEEIGRARFRLNQDYDYFTGQFGPISQSANVRVFAGDPDLPLLLSLENYDEDRNTAAKTAIFTERTIEPPRPVEQAANAKEAVVITLSEKGRVDLDHMEKLLGKPEKEFLPDLAGVLYRNPVESWRWETDDAYLSGNVREKLAAAVKAAKVNPIYKINVEALRSVQPVDLKATEIDARLGAVWIPSTDIEAFTRELLKLKGHDGEGVKVGHAHQLGLWTVNVGYYGKHSVANNTEWGTERVSAAELVADALNLRTPTVYDLDAKKNPVINPSATEAAREKQQKIKDRFAEWVWENDARRERLVRKYNDEFNCHRLRAFNGDHLTLPGASPSITLRSHQKAAVWRILQSPNTLLAHVVGAGIMPDGGICRIGSRCTSGGVAIRCGIIRHTVDAGMVNTSFIPARTIGALQSSPLFAYIERYVTQLREQGYKKHTVEQHVQLFGRLDRWLARKRCTIRAMNEESIEAFLKQVLAGRSLNDGAPLALYRLLEVLRAAGVTPRNKPVPRTPAQCLADDYRTYLRVERGFADHTVINYTRHIDRFLAERFGAEQVNLRQLKIGDVIGFVRRTTRTHNQCFTNQLVTALRSFLRFLHYRGKIATDWAPSVPVVAHWRLTALPKALPPGTVQRVLDKCDQATAVGRRDYAILLLLARLGLRGGEVCGMQLEDIDWEGAQITIRSKKGRGWARMPLPADVGEAIARYLRHDRPTCSCRNVFLRMVAPYRQLANSAVVAIRAAAAMRRAGVEVARKGAHIFRHSLASEMLRQGASLEEIGQVLRHRDPDTTAIYAKADLNALRRLAVPLPGGVQ